MKARLLLCALLIITTGTLYGQATNTCDINVLLHTSKNAGHLRQFEISDFLKTFDATCEDHDEYMEWSHELLLELLDSQTELLLKTLQREARTLDMEMILAQFAVTADDGPVDELVKKVQATKIDTYLKNLVLEKLKHTTHRR